MKHFDASRRLLAISLAGLAGFVDASGFLANGGYFMSFMSGNTTRLGVNIALGSAAALIPALLIAGFCAGVMLGALLVGIMERRGADRWRKPAVLALVAGLLLMAAGARSMGWAIVAQGAMVLAMGALNNTFLRDGEVLIGLTYMTGALVKTAQGLAARLLGRRDTGWSAQALLWAGLALGGVLGSLAWLRLGLACEWIGAVWALACAWAAYGIAKSA